MANCFGLRANSNCKRKINEGNTWGDVVMDAAVKPNSLGNSLIAYELLKKMPTSFKLDLGYLQCS